MSVYVCDCVKMGFLPWATSFVPEVWLSLLRVQPPARPSGRVRSVDERWHKCTSICSGLVFSH